MMSIAWLCPICSFLVKKKISWNNKVDYILVFQTFFIFSAFLGLQTIKPFINE
jgi:hypothetical protein